LIQNLLLTLEGPMLQPYKVYSITKTNKKRQKVP